MKYLFSNLDLPQDKISESKIILPPCKCGNSRVTVSPDKISNFAQWVCSECADFRGWVEHPDDAADLDEDVLQIEDVLQTEDESQPEYKLPESQIMLPPCDCGETKVAALKSWSHEHTSHWAEWLCLECANHRGWIDHPDTPHLNERGEYE